MAVITTKKTRRNSQADVTVNSSAPPELVIITGRSGSGKQTVLKAFEDLGFYAVDNLPIALVPKFAELTRDRSEEHTSEFQSQFHLVCRLLLEKKKQNKKC